MTSLFNTDKIVVVTGKDALNLDLEMKKKGLHMYFPLALKIIIYAHTLIMINFWSFFSKLLK